MQETQVWSLIRENPTCCGTTKPILHNYWVCALETRRYNYWTCAATTEACALREKPPQWKAVARQLEKSMQQCQMVKGVPTMRETRVQSLGQEDPLEKKMATHSSIFAWRISWTEEPGRLQSTGLQKVRHNWATSLSLSHFNNSGSRFRDGNDYPLQYSCLEHPMDRGPWWTTVHEVTKSQIWLSDN